MSEVKGTREGSDLPALQAAGDRAELEAVLSGQGPEVWRAKAQELSENLETFVAFSDQMQVRSNMLKLAVERAEGSAGPDFRKRYQLAKFVHGRSEELAARTRIDLFKSPPHILLANLSIVFLSFHEYFEEARNAMSEEALILNNLNFKGDNKGASEAAFLSSCENIFELRAEIDEAGEHFLRFIAKVRAFPADKLGVQDGVDPELIYVEIDRFTADQKRERLNGLFTAIERKIAGLNARVDACDVEFLRGVANIDVKIATSKNAEEWGVDLLRKTRETTETSEKSPRFGVLAGELIVPFTAVMAIVKKWQEDQPGYAEGVREALSDLQERIARARTIADCEQAMTEMRAVESSFPALHRIVYEYSSGIDRLKAVVGRMIDNLKKENQPVNTVVARAVLPVVLAYGKKKEAQAVCGRLWYESRVVEERLKALGGGIEYPLDGTPPPKDEEFERKVKELLGAYGETSPFSEGLEQNIREASEFGVRIFRLLATKFEGDVGYVFPNMREPDEIDDPAGKASARAWKAKVAEDISKRIERYGALLELANELIAVAETYRNGEPEPEMEEEVVFDPDVLVVTNETQDGPPPLPEPEPEPEPPALGGPRADEFISGLVGRETGEVPNLAHGLAPRNAGLATEPTSVDSMSISQLIRRQTMDDLLTWDQLDELLAGLKRDDKTND